MADPSGSFAGGGSIGMGATGGSGSGEPAPELALGSSTGFTGPTGNEFTIDVAQGVAITNANLILDSQNTAALIDVTAVTPVTTANGIVAPAPSTNNAVGTAFTFSGTPTAVGTTSFDVDLDDGLFTKRWRVTFNVVTGVAPIITSTAPTTVTGATLYTYTVTATGTPAPTFSAAGLPTWLTFVGDTLSGTPTANGTYGPITITAANGIAPDDTEIFSIVVSGIVTPPTGTVGGGGGGGGGGCVAGEGASGWMLLLSALSLLGLASRYVRRRA